MVEKNDNGASFRTREHQWVHLRGIADSSLPSAIEPGSTMREAIWGVDTAANLQALAAELSRDREVKSHSDGSVHTHDDAGIPIGFAVAKPANLDITAPLMNVGRHSVRVNRAVDEITKVWPMRLIHVVYDVPQNNWQSFSAFYIDRLGFRLSDRSLNAGDFLRCSMDHHNLFLLNRNNKLGYNHVAIEVRDLDEIMKIGRAHV